MRHQRRLFALCAAWLGAVLVCMGPASAADKVHAGKAAGVAWTFTLLDVGVAQGLFARYGIDLEISNAAGDAKLQQALASQSLDFGLGSGPSMAFSAKGAPVIAVAAFAGAPRNIAIMVGDESPIKTIKDLKGKSVAVTTAGSLTEWLAKQASIQEGLGPDGIKTVALGTMESSVAALQVHQVDGIVGAVESGYRLEERHAGRILTGLEKYAPHFITHVIFARRDLVQNKPDLVARFLKGVFASIAFMKTNRDKTVAIGARVLDMSQGAMERTYDYEIAMFSDDGVFDPKAVETLKDSYVAMGTLPDRPKDEQIFTTQFVPVKP
ncbi:MAG TPA: ABC transporter substrate-binding protein [Stellaceae bacterium]|nr:ABC transporter substrate-binding protein [Stellaceae bacterium]